MLPAMLLRLVFRVLFHSVRRILFDQQQQLRDDFALCSSLLGGNYPFPRGFLSVCQIRWFSGFRCMKMLLLQRVPNHALRLILRGVNFCLCYPFSQFSYQVFKRLTQFYRILWWSRSAACISEGVWRGFLKLESESRLVWEAYEAVLPFSITLSRSGSASTFSLARAIMVFLVVALFVFEPEDLFSPWQRIFPFAQFHYGHEIAFLILCFA